MPIFDSLVHTFGTAGTGGFGIKADCLASYTPYQQWITAIFMLIFGVNFNLYYLILIRRARSAFKSEELWAYIGIVLVASGIICYNIRSIYPAVSDAARQSVFQVASIITTTGYSTANFDTWPQLSRHILLILMFIGGCAGSTAGGLKVSRVVMMIKNIKINLKKLIHPRAVGTVRFEGKAVESETLQGLGVYFGLYSVLLILTLLILAFDPIAYNIETNFSAAVSCFNNVGPGLGGVGPALSYADYSPLSKLVLSFSMLLGRLEIYPLILIMFPSTWRRGQ
jgi:trk system potassium uptake protein